MNGNPFFVQSADYSNAFGQLSQGMSNLQQQQQAKEQQAQQQKMTADIQDAVNSGDLNRIADISIQYPQMAQNIKSAVGFKNEATEGNFKDTAFKILSDPQNTEQYLMDRAEVVKAQGGDPTQTLKEIEMFRNDPKRFLQTTEGVAASMYGQDYKNWYESMNRGQGQKPTANMQDFAEYERLLKEDPVMAERFARQVGISGKDAAQVKPTTAMQNFDKWQSLPDGPEKKAFAQAIGITPKDTPAEARIKAEQIDMLSTKVQSAQDTIGTIDEILGDDSLSEMVGIASAFPTIPGGGVADLEAKVEQFRNQLTLENLDKMSGVLTDRDIQVLASAASGLETSMSPDAFKRQLNKIKSTLNRGINKNKSKLKGIAPEKAQPEFAGAPSVGTIEGGYEYLGGDPASPKSWRAK